MEITKQMKHRIRRENDGMVRLEISVSGDAREALRNVAAAQGKTVSELIGTWALAAREKFTGRKVAAPVLSEQAERFPLSKRRLYEHRKD